LSFFSSGGKWIEMERLWFLPPAKRASEKIVEGKLAAWSML
jgi:hypothetical protein